MRQVKHIDFGTNDISDISIESDLSSVLYSEESVAYTIRWQLARRRSGTAKTKLMSEISGTTAKPHKQKGSGKARQGSRRSVQFVGGRTCFGPLPRSFDFSLPKGISISAISSVLKAKIESDDLSVISYSGASAYKTSDILSLLNKSGINNALIALDFLSPDSVGIIKGIRNLKGFKAIDIRAINAYDVVKFDKLLVEKDSLDNILAAL